MSDDNYFLTFDDGEGYIDYYALEEEEEMRIRNEILTDKLISDDHYVGNYKNYQGRIPYDSRRFKAKSKYYSKF